MKRSLTSIADLVGGEIHGDGTMEIFGAAPFETATPTDITFAAHANYQKKINETKAGAIIVPGDFGNAEKTLLKVRNPQVAFAKVIEVFYPRNRQNPGIDATVSMGANFKCGKDVSLTPFVVIQNNVTLGDRVILHPHVFIGDDVEIGDDTEIFPNVTIFERSKIGNRVIIHSGTVIGSDGFGFAPDGETYYKIPQIGIVQIDDDVEIGACNTIDRATFGKTWIQKGVKTDNLVQIAHNVIVGENSILVAQVGISGSVTIGRHAIIAGQAGISGHLSIGDGATIAPQCGVAKSVPNGAVVSGTPERPHRQHLRILNIFSKLPELKKKLDTLEKRLNTLEEALHV